MPLRPKTFAVLQNLAQRRGELVSKQALLDAVWSDVAVTEDVVRLSVGELRAALGDKREAPRFIETVPRRGYRFIATGCAAGIDIRLTDAELPPVQPDPGDGAVVGRARERAEIAQWLRAAAGGRRQIGFIAGEAGIGKTTLVQTVLRDMRRASGGRLRVASGQCVEHYGGGEPYLPLLEALTSLRAGSERPSVEATLRDRAPAWLLDVMRLGAPAKVERAEPATNHEHTLHKLADSIDALAADTPLVLVLEDVQWCDYSTLDLLSVIAQRREPARLLIVCTLRPADAIVCGHPVVSIKRELVRKALGHEILLGGLSPADIASYLTARFPGAGLPEDLLRLLVDRSEGNPFFMAVLVDHLLEQRLLVEAAHGWQLRKGLETLRTAIPDGLRAVIEPRLERLTHDELRVLEAASVAGPEFAAHAAARMGASGSDLADVEYVERLCDALARRQGILRGTGESAWPDGTASTRYAFRHSLYHQVIYQRLSPTTRRRLHQTIGEGLEAAYGDRTGEVAGALAAHFERSRDAERAIRYHAEAAAQARSRFAYREARLHLEAAVALVRAQPETPERLRQEIAFLQDLGVTLFAIKGYGNEDGARVFARMRDIAERLAGGMSLLQAMEGQLIVHTMRAEFAVARALGEETIVLAEQLGNAASCANTHLVHGATLFNLGEVEAARRHAERGRALFDPAAVPLPADLGILSGILLASSSGYFGIAAAARTFYREALERAALLGDPFHRALATNLAAQVCMLLDDVADAGLLAREALQLASEYDFAALQLTAAMVCGWSDVEEGRVDEGRAALSTAFDAYGATGQHFGTTSFSMILARAHLAGSDAARAHQVAESGLAFAAATGERVYEPEFHRLQGESLLAGGATRTRKADARACFERALAIAAERKALLFELRAATSLYRVQKSGRERLTRLVDRFDADNDCADVRAARALL